MQNTQIHIKKMRLDKDPDRLKAIFDCLKLKRSGKKKSGITTRKSIIHANTRR